MNEFVIGDRVLVHDGYDGVASKWLAGRNGYTGTILELNDVGAVVELDDELVLTGGTWQDFGNGSEQALGTVDEARGRYLLLLHTWVGAKWVNPASPVHVAVSANQLLLANVPKGGGAGIWVESHATVSRVVAPSGAAPDTEREPGVTHRRGVFGRIFGRH